MSVILTGTRPPSEGMFAIEDGYRNGVVPPGPRLRNLAFVTDKILAHRKKILFRRTIGPGTGTTSTYGDCYNALAAATTWRARFHTSPSLGQVWARYIVIPVDNTVANAPTPRARWVTTPDGGAATNQAYIYNEYRVTAGSSITPDQWTVVDQPLASLSADTSYKAELTQENQLRIIQCVIWEVPQQALDTTVDTYAIDPAKFHVLGNIRDADAAAMLAAQTRIFKRQGSNLFSYTVPGTTARTTTNTTGANILDATTGAWAIDNAGFQIDPQYKGPIETYNSGTNRETLSVHCWAAMSIPGGATASAIFRDQNGTIATLTTTSGTVAYVTSNTTWVAPSNATMKMDVMLKTSDAAQIASLWAAGMYVYEA